MLHKESGFSRCGILLHLYVTFSAACGDRRYRKEAMSQYLFAYGTLQPGCAPAKVAHLAAKLRVVGEGFVRGALYDLGGYPGAIPDENSENQIAGTVMLLPEDESALRRLDAYEGFDPRSPETSEYVRELRHVELVTGDSLQCWIYIFKGKPDQSRVIASGVWGKVSGGHVA
jgi:gamma-glutamylcyclotransferase (GGCT)/AIG2-like uncharacterized protein YtfP